MPEPAPVTSATLLSSRNIIVLLLSLVKTIPAIFSHQSYFILGLPHCASRKRMCHKGFGIHFTTIARSGRRHIVSIANDHWIAKVLVQVIDIFDDTVLQRGTDRDVIEDRDMLHIFAETNAARMWTHRHAKFRGHQQNSQHLVDSTHAASINLAKADSIGLQ